MVVIKPSLAAARRLTKRLGLVAFVAGQVLVHEVFAAELASPSQAAVNTAIGINLMSYARSYSGGAHTNGAGTGGAAITLAVASHAGNTSADARLLQQIRHTLTPGKEPTCNGGYPAQHNLHVTGMFVIVKNTPAIWNQLTAAEKARIDVIMKASLVSCAFTTSDNNPFILAKTQQYTLDADSNLSRNWNPNYREGMIGGVLVGIAYFGPATADAILSTYQHNSFIAELAAGNFPNIHEIFNWKVANPTSKAPTAAQIEAAVRTYRFFTHTVTNYLSIYQNLVSDTYSATIAAGLNNGAGIDGAGKIASGAGSLPNKGLKGMLKEFASVDANGARSSFVYAFDGYRPHMTNQISLIVSGLWPEGTSIADQAATLVTIGNTDLWYKADKGYIGYAKGKSQGLLDYSTHSTIRGFVYNRSLWDDVLKPFHNSPGGGGVDPPDAEEFKPGARIWIPKAATLLASASNTAASTGSVPFGTPASILEGPLVQNEIEWWRVIADTGVSGWIPRPDFKAGAATEFIDTAGGGWKNRRLPPQTGTFTLSFNMWASGTGIDAVTGVAASDATAFTNLAIAIRFAPTGVIDARNGGSYQAVNSLTYQPGVLYRVRIDADVATRRYSATVTPAGGSAVTIANNYAFRTEQASVTSLSRLATIANPGSHIVSRIVLEGPNSLPPPVPTGFRLENQP
jgi:hypothetical protein